MSFKRVGLGLGYFSSALGGLEVAVPGRIARALGLDSETAKNVIRAFGVRELAAGVMLLRGPAVSTNVWNRVVGDLIDAASLAIAAPDSRRKGAIAGALAVVGAATALDFATAVGLDRETGRTFPRLEPQQA